MDPTNLPFGFALPGHAHMPIPPTANMLAGHPGPTASPPQSVPGRRTPLGSVGLGGFYAQGGISLSQHGPPTDENKPGPSGGIVGGQKSPNSNMLLSGGTTTAANIIGSGGGGSSGVFISLQVASLYTEHNGCSTFRLGFLSCRRKIASTFARTA